MNFFQLPIVLAVFQFGAGFLMKRWPTFPKLLIPVATYVIGIFGYAVAPADANAATTLAGVIGGSSIFLMALVQNFMVTGIHSTWKNTLFPSLRAVFAAFGKK